MGALSGADPLSVSNWLDALDPCTCDGCGLFYCRGSVLRG